MEARMTKAPQSDHILLGDAENISAPYEAKFKIQRDQSNHLVALEALKVVKLPGN